MEQYFNYITGKWQDYPVGSTGGFVSGTGSSTNPVDIDGATIKPKSTKAGLDIAGLLSGGAAFITSVGNLFGATRTTPVMLPPGTPPPGDEPPKKDNTMLYILGGAAVIIALILFMKKK